MAHCIRSTCPRARVDTLLSDTGSVAWTFGIDGTFWATIGRNSNIVRQTGAGSNFIGISALRELSTRCWVARINRLRSGRRLCYHNSDTVAEWIASKSWRTLADRVVVGDLTPGVITTGTGARINTLLIDTSSQLVTIRADHALWATVRRSSLECRGTCTHTYSINFSVLAVGSARIGITWVSINFNRLGWRYDLTSRGWIARVAGVTRADWIVISY